MTEATTPAPKRGRGRPRKETEADKRIRELEDRLAAALMLVEQKDTAPAPKVEEAPSKDDYVTVHFVEDGFTALGELWRQGQELSVSRSGDKYKETLDSEGNSWLDWDEGTQIRKKKKIFFKKGPAPEWMLMSMEQLKTADIGKLPEGAIPRVVRFD